jgi:TonB family protein
MSITTILWGLFLVILLTTGVIYLTRLFFKKQACKNLTALHKNEHWSSPLEGRNKYPEVNTFLLSGAFMNYGLIVALVLMIFAFSWTTYEAKVDLSQYTGTLIDEIEMETPRTAEPPPPPPPPPAPQAMEIVANDMPDVEAVVFQDQSISEETAIEAPVVDEPKKVAPPPPPPIVESEQEIFKIVEQNPTFPGCEEMTDKMERQKCAEEKMLQFIYSKIAYPAVARDNGVQGMVVLQFVVEKDGSITNIKIVRDAGAGCGDEARRVVSLMPRWNPGKQRGRPVRVQFTLPVKFLLE